MNKENKFSSHFHRITDPQLLSNMLGLLRDHPVLREAAAISDAELADRRRAVGEKIDALQKALDAKAPALRDAAVRAEREVLDIEPRYEAAVVRLRRANSALNVLSYETTVQIDRLRGEIEATADPIIDETIWELNRLFQENLRVQPMIAGHVYGRDFDRTGARTIVGVRHTRPSLVARSEAILAAREACLALKREVQVEDLPGRLAKLIAELPSGETIVEEKV
ncbi:hypothetical protein [Mesorhizobium sp. M0058]|uniref:hypothetical protein n=1 Tax=Mesorhizobium sp. M0058 TaxID=2956865 RepID=UPI003335C4B1